MECTIQYVCRISKGIDLGVYNVSLYLNFSSKIDLSIEARMQKIQVSRGPIKF